MYVGGIAGFCKSAVKNCLSSKESEIVGYDITNDNVKPSYVGGIVGKLESTAEDCRNEGAVVNGSFVGGIAGQSEGWLDQCINAGPIFADQ